MNNTVYTSTPVVLAEEPQHPVARHKNSLCGIGIMEIFIGLYAAGLGFYYVVQPYVYGADAFAIVMISAGIWIIISGSLAIASGSCPNGCNTVCGIIVAIIATFAAVAVMVKEAFVLKPVILSCQEGYCLLGTGLMIAHLVLAVLGFVEFILSIVHASYCCSCCGRPYAPARHVGVTVTTTSVPPIQPVAFNPGKGYVPLINQPDPRYSMAYAPQQPQAYSDYPPSYSN